MELWDKAKVTMVGMMRNMRYIRYRVSSLTIPVRPGRNLAIIVELAAMNNSKHGI